MKFKSVCLIAISLSCCSPKEPADQIIQYTTDIEGVPTVEEVAYETTADAPLLPSEDPRKLIREGSLAFEVRSVNNAYDSIKRIIKSLHGYFSDEETVNNDLQVEQRIQIRIEENQFDEAIDQVLALATKVESRSITIHDVTEEYTDIAARLKAKKGVEVRYTEILGQAKTVKDMLDIEGQLGSVREDIESMEARMKLMSSQVAYSTIQIRFSEHIVLARAQEPGLGSRLVLSVHEGWNNLVSLLLALVALWPFLLGIGSLCIILIRLFKRRRKAATNPLIG
jgi:hypothetical protein